MDPTIQNINGDISIPLQTRLYGFQRIGGVVKLQVIHVLVNLAYCAMYNLTQGRYVAPFVILTLQGLTLELKEGNNGRVHHGTTIQAGVFTIHL